MTDQEIVEALAIHLMGWQFTDDDQVIGEHARQDAADTVWFRRADGSIGVVGLVTMHTFNPLADPAACALVLDEVERQGWGWAARYKAMPYNVETPYTFILWDTENPPAHWSSEADSRFRAVCLAACGLSEWKSRGVANEPTRSVE